MTQLSALVQAARRDANATDVKTPGVSIPFFSRDAVRFAAVLMQFGLLVLLIRQYDLERGSLGDVMLLAWVGFAIHHFLPPRLRLPFFAGLSIASIPLAIGLRIGMFVLVGGYLLIGVCHLKWPFKLRVLALILIVLILVGLRANFLVTVGLHLDIPRLIEQRTDFFAAPIVVIGSMFMFRLIVYVVDLKNRAAPTGFFRTTSYFFMLPNVCFPLFPLVDYKTFCTTYFNDAPPRIYQTGVRWMFRGVVQLLLYRVIYQFGQEDALQVTDLGGAARFMVATFLLYLRISGQFHLIVGVLHLFGFNLPETHHLYLLSSSFTDFWRRINVYWKDFLLKIFFYPAYFRLKRWGPTAAMIGATVYAFFATWLLHAYQALWLRGTWAFTWQDTVFWWSLAGLVLVNATLEAKRGRQRAIQKPARTIRGELGHALRTIGTFLVICALWNVWSAESGEELVRLAAAAQNVTLLSVVAIVAALCGLGVAAVLFGSSSAERTEASRGTQRAGASYSFWPSAGVVTAGALAVMLFGAIPSIPAAQNTLLGEVVQSLKKDRLNDIEVNARTRGYYEELDVSRQDVGVKLALEGSTWPAMKLHRNRDDFMMHEPIPNAKVLFRGKIFEFNRQGMRGPLYLPAKAPGVFRIALLGSSHEVGRGVNEEDTFARKLEDRLNREDTDAVIRKFEVLNFAVEGYGAIQKLQYLREKVFTFDPDLVMFVTYRREAERTADQLAHALPAGREFPEPFETAIRAACAEAHVDGLTPFTRIERQLMPYVPAIVEEVFREVAATCRTRGVRGCFVYRPEVGEFLHLQAAQRREVNGMAERTGLTVLDLSAAFAGEGKPESLMVEPEGTFNWRTLRREGIDDHPNNRAHQLLADELYRQLHKPEGHGLLKPRDTK